MLRSENNQNKAQLVVDGLTSLSAAGWNQCLPRRPLPIADLPSTAQFAVSSSTAERVMKRGTLYVGYFNGGVGHLQFAAQSVDMYSLWLTTTLSIRMRNAIREDAYRGLGWTLIALGIVGFATALLSSGRDLVKQHRETAADEVSTVMEQYNAVWSGQHASQELAEYAMCPYDRAKELLSLTDYQLGLFLAEIRQNTAFHLREIIRLLYIMHDVEKNGGGDGVPNLGLPIPTSAEWNTAVISTTSGDEGQPGEGDQARLRGATEHRENVPEPARSYLIEDHSEVRDGNDDESAGRSPRNSPRHRTAVSKKGGVMPVNAGSAKTATTAKESQHNSATAVAVPATTAPRLPATDVKEFISPILLVVQSVYVWMSSANLPTVYRSYFGGFFSFISIDWAVAFPSVPTIITPLLQLFVGLIVFGFLMYFSQIDEQIFAWNMARYTLRRDKLDADDRRNLVQNVRSDGLSEAVRQPPQETEKALMLTDDSYAEVLFPHIEHPFGKEVGCPYAVTANCLPLKACQQIDLFTGKASVGSSAASADATVRKDIRKALTVTVHDADGNGYLLRKAHRGTSSNDKIIATEMLASSESDDELESVDSDAAAFAEGRKLEVLGICCRKHTDRRLAPQFQTETWPFQHAPSCCVVLNGARCGEKLGRIFCCGARESLDAGSQEEYLCNYAVCEKHFRAGFVDNLKADAAAFARSVRDRGYGWLLATVTVFVANAAYMPFLKTALMILACHPYYQCEFKHCWSSPDQKYTLAVYLAFIVVAFFGVGFPLSQFLLLRRRKHLLHTVFFSKECAERFTTTDESGNASVSLTEWTRFVATDPTALAAQYRVLHFRWLYLPPILLVWKVGLLAPAVFLEPGSLTQLIGISAVEIAFGFFMFLLQPSLAPMTTALYRLGAVHQAIFLGLQALNVDSQYKGKGNLNGYLIATTLAYLLFCLMCIIWAAVWPAVKQAIDKKKSTKALSALGLQYSLSTSLYLVPAADAVAANPCEDMFIES